MSEYFDSYDLRFRSLVFCLYSESPLRQLGQLTTPPITAAVVTARQLARGVSPVLPPT